MTAAVPAPIATKMIFPVSCLCPFCFGSDSLRVNAKGRGGEVARQPRAREALGCVEDSVDRLVATLQ